MPRSRRYRRKSRRPRRRTARRSRPRRSRKGRSIPINAIPTKMMTKHRYFCETIINASANAPAVYKIRANSVYDPDETSTGHQPRGTDRMFTMYDHCTVVGSKITVQHMATTQGNQVPGYIDVHVTDDNQLQIAEAIDLFETHQGRGFPQHVGTERNYIGFNPRITRKFSAKKFFGSSVMGKAPYRHTNSTNPSEEAYFQIIMCNMLGNEPAPMSIMIMVEYVCVWTEQRYEARS